MKVINEDALSTDEELEAREIDDYDRWAINSFIDCFDESPRIKHFVKNVLYDFLALKENYKH
jgi:hypothetical protein